jgi:hypothetical protein
MSATDYRCKTSEEVATVPYIAHSVIVKKHQRREKALLIALIASVALNVITNILIR